MQGKTSILKTVEKNRRFQTNEQFLDKRIVKTNEDFENEQTERQMNVLRYTCLCPGTEFLPKSEFS